MKKRWQVAPPLPGEVDHALNGLPAIMRQILYNRGISSPADAHRFLEAEPPDGTSPEAMRGIPEAVDRITRAIEHQESIAVYGDYDADGVTATALLTQALRTLGASVREYIPNRFDEGYGLNKEALQALYDQGVRLVITVDCGVRSIPEVEFAHNIGLELIISDHHHPGSEPPKVLALINPKQEGCTYPDKNLAGVGLAFKLACALLARCNPSLSPETYLDLVALGTVADLVPLIGENRFLVRAGLDHIRRPHRQGLMALMGSAGITHQTITASEISFGLGPRLNAAGRLDSALASLRLLLSEDIFEAGQLAQQLEIQNRERQQITVQIQEQAEKMALEKDPETLLLVALHPDFNRGVIGLAASRLTERFYRPSLVAHIGEEFTRGSCRSIPEFNITRALDLCADLLEHHGGHAAAAGFTVRNENLQALIERLQFIAFDTLAHADLRPTLVADVEVPLSDLRPDLLHYLNWLQPTGFGNPQAIFVSRDLKVVSSRAVGKEATHLKLSVTDGHITYDAIAFRQGHWAGNLPAQIDLLYTFEVNEFNGRSNLQLNVRDLKPAGSLD